MKSWVIHGCWQGYPRLRRTQARRRNIAETNSVKRRLRVNKGNHLDSPLLSLLFSWRLATISLLEKISVSFWELVIHTKHSGQMGVKRHVGREKLPWWLRWQSAVPNFLGCQMARKEASGPNPLAVQELSRKTSQVQVQHDIPAISCHPGTWTFLAPSWRNHRSMEMLAGLKANTKMFRRLHLDPCTTATKVLKNAMHPVWAASRHPRRH